MLRQMVGAVGRDFDVELILYFPALCLHKGLGDVRLPVPVLRKQCELVVYDQHKGLFLEFSVFSGIS